MRRYHVHVYEVVALYEVNVDAAKDSEAMEKALTEARVGNYEMRLPGCRYIAIPFREDPCKRRA